MQRILSLAPPNGLRAWKLMDMDDLPHWSLNRTVLLGDCCHPVLPFGFSGASMALEDAIMLSILLPAHVRDTDIPQRLQAWEDMRRPRVARVRHDSRRTARNQMDKESYEAYFKFLIAYDPIKAASDKGAELPGQEA